MQRGMGFFRCDDFGAKCADAMLQTAGWSRSKSCYKSGSDTIRCLWYRLAAREEEAVESNFRSSCSLREQCGERSETSLAGCRSQA